MNKEYNIGDKVFWAKYNHEQVKKDCPVCFDKKEVVVILGNGEKIKIPCDYCNRGMSGARGYIEEYEWLSNIKEIIIDGKEITENSKGKSIEYRYQFYSLNNNDIFDTKEKAEKRVVEKIKEREIEEATRYQYSKNGNIMKLSWSVGYHMQQVKKAEKEIEYHSKKVELVKKLIKEKK